MKRSSTLTWDQLRVGLVILFSVLIIAVAIYKLGEAANLFSTTPPDLPAGSTCAEDGKPSTVIQAAGVPLEVKDWLPFPGASRAPDPHRL